MFDDVGEEATSVTTLQAKEVGTSAKFREKSEGLRSLSRGNAQTQSEGVVVRIEGIRKEGVERKTEDGVAI